MKILLRSFLTGVLLAAASACVDEQPMAPDAATPGVASPALMPLPGAERQITSSPGNQQLPSVWGDRIVWVDDSSGTGDIYLYDLNTNTETQLTTDAAHETWADIWEDKVVWWNSRVGSSDIYLHDIGTGTEVRLTAGGDPRYPAISEDRVAWADSGHGNSDIYVHDLNTGTTSRITADAASQTLPDISGERVVWVDYRHGNSDIYLYDLSSGTETRITTDAAAQEAPSIWGEKIVWQDGRHGNPDIYLYDVSTGTETRITADPAAQLRPAIWESTIVWQDDRHGDNDIYLYDLSTGAEARVASNSASQFNPAIWGGRIAWSDARNGDTEIYVFETASVSNGAPIADAGGAYTGTEGRSVHFDGSTSSDPDGDPLTYLWDFGDGTAGTGANPTHSYADDGEYTVTLVVNDGTIDSESVTTIATITNGAPDLGGITTSTLEPIAVNATSLHVSVAFSDSGVLDTHAATIDWGDGTTSSGATTEANGSGSVSGSHLYTGAGVYTVTVTLSDDDGGSDGESYQYVVVYDPNAGFVTGGGWIESPAGAYVPDASLSGKAIFGFVSRYRRGANVPTGSTEFRFHAGGMKFHSDVQEWLVVNQGGSNAQFKGTGTINGAGSYKFMIWAGDDAPDTFRIRIWEEIGGVETSIYDNGVAQAISGGSIKIHTR